MEKYDDEDQWKPFPELVASEKGAYEIIDSRDLPGLPTTGMTDKVKRVLYVPLDAAGRIVSQHELAHVAWSPREVQPKRLGVSIMLLQAVEDARVNLGLRQVGMALEFDGTVCDEVLAIAHGDLERDDIVAFLLRAVASFGTNVERRILACVDGDGDPIFATVRELARGTYVRLERARWRDGGMLASFRRAVRVARWLTRELRKRGFPEPKDGMAVLVGCLGSVREGAKRTRRGGLLPGVRIADGVTPGRLRVVEPPLLQRCEAPSLRRGHRKRSAEEGTEFRHFHRLFYDRRVFARPIRRRAPAGGTVLIDVSGSMSLTAAHIDGIISAAPAATLVAIYSGSGDRGELCVVVRNGHRAAARDLEPYGGGNIVDLPALKWLARQAAPRVWISDGRVTGCNDVATDAIGEQCKEICAEAGIVRVLDAAGAVKALSKNIFSLTTFRHVTGPL